VLDLTVEARRFGFDAASMVALYAPTIENRLLQAQSRDHLILRFQASPTLLGTPLEALAGIAHALDVPAAWLLLDSGTPPRVVRAAERPVTATDCARIAEVDAGTSRDVCMLEVTVDPGHSTGVHAHNGDEHHVVLSGRWRMTQGDHVVELGPGDYLAWDPAIPHDVENISDEPASMLVVYPRRGRRPSTEDRTRA
jgi:mannose-6-phosphate isomerase-like protein (cupin superfamily)